MAQFKEVTGENGEKFFINLDQVCEVKRFDSHSTKIRFGKDIEVSCREKPAEVIRP